MADVSQPSSLTLEPNPFEQSFASKAQEQHTARKSENQGGDGTIGASAQSGLTPRSGILASNGAIAKENNGNVDSGAPEKKDRHIPGIDKIMTPLPLIPGSVQLAPTRGYNQAYALNAINISSPSRWTRQGAFTPTLNGTPTYEGYTGITEQMQQMNAPNTANGTVRPGEAPEVSPSISIPPGIPHQSPMLPYGASFSNAVRAPVPLDSPGILMNVPLAPNVPYPGGNHPNQYLPIHPQQNLRNSNDSQPRNINQGVRSEIPGDINSQQILAAAAMPQQRPTPRNVPPHVIEAPPPPPPTQPQPQGLQHDGNGPPQGLNTAANGLYLLSQEHQRAPLDSKVAHSNPEVSQQQQQQQQKQQQQQQQQQQQHNQPVAGSDSRSFSRNLTQKTNKGHGEDSGTFDKLSTPHGYPPSLDRKSPSARPSRSSKKRSASSSNSEGSDSKEELDAKRPNTNSIQTAGTTSPPSASLGSANTSDIEEVERRKMFLERNRIAAIKCRQRKKQWVNELKTKADIYSQMSEDLQRDNQKLKSDIEQLRQFILAYHDIRSIPHNIISILNFANTQQGSAATNVPDAESSFTGNHEHQ